MSYTELAASYPNLSKKERKKIQKGTVLEWANGAKKIAEERGDILRLSKLKI